MPLHHRPLKMCEYNAEESDGTLDTDMLLFRLRELIQPRTIKAAESVAMFTHDNPAPEVRRRFLHFAFAYFAGVDTNCILTIQLSTLTEEDLAPRYYDAGTRPKKRKLISTKDLEKKKKAAVTTEAEDEILGSKIPTKQR